MCEHLASPASFLLGLEPWLGLDSYAQIERERVIFSETQLPNPRKGPWVRQHWGHMTTSGPVTGLQSMEHSDWPACVRYLDLSGRWCCSIWSYDRAFRSNKKAKQTHPWGTFMSQAVLPSQFVPQVSSMDSNSYFYIYLFPTCLFH